MLSPAFPTNPQLYVEAMLIIAITGGIRATFFGVPEATRRIQALGDALGHYAGQWGYPTILQALQAARDHSTKEVT